MLATISGKETRMEAAAKHGSSAALGVQQLRLFVGSWNVGGRAPTMETRKSVQEWLQTPQHQPAQIGLPSDPDIYVLGLQEMVPLTASNVLRGENGCSTKMKLKGGMLTRDLWESLISEALNQNLITRATPCHSSIKHDEDRASFPLMPSATVFPLAEHETSGSGSFNLHASQFIRIANKQMVGLFITVWARRSLRPYIKNVQVSSVGCGVLNRLGNKGSVSISLSVHETSLCFICSHLRSGESPYDMMRRNSDLQNILHRTKFTCLDKPSPNFNCQLPSSILAHDRIILLGDLNCRLNIAPMELTNLLLQQDWKMLLEKDELKATKGVGGVLQGWQEGSIYFAPTYKYLFNSDTYWFANDNQASMKRAPAWCDRILWHGKGVKQLLYTRCESKHSDHRPVRSLFMVDIEFLAENLIGDDSHLDNQRLTFSKEIQELLCFKNDLFFGTFRMHALGKN